ncbi:MAG TPA: hypothetical protein VNP73_09870 [Actinomycetota bacterium]|nr:hypothetical protein [Actinomycetota bacterium]
MAAARAFDAAPADWQVRLFEDVPEGAHAVVVCPDVDSHGILFDPSQPAAAFEEVEARLACGHEGRSIHVAGTGGGVGTTSVAIHLAAALGRTSSTCLIELDPNRAMADRLGLDPSDARWEEIDDGSDGLGRAAVPIGGFRVLTRPEVVADGTCKCVLEAAINTFALTIIDAGAFSPSCVHQPSLLVMPPSLPGARRARAFLDERPDEVWGVVSNRLGPGSETTRAMIERNLGRRLLSELPCTPGLRDAEDEGRILSTPWSRWLQKITRLAALVSG